MTPYLSPDEMEGEDYDFVGTNRVKIYRVRLILIRGLPGSGKSTIAKGMTGFEHFEADQFFMRNGEYLYDPEKQKEAHAWCLQQVRNALADRRKVVVSNTFAQKWEMEPYFKAASASRARFKVIEAKGQWSSVHGVPEEVIATMRNRWEKL